MEHKTVVIDNGTGYTKMGYAGNFDPNYIIPTCIADCPEKVHIFFYFNSPLSIYLSSNTINSISLLVQRQLIRQNNIN